MLNLTLCGLNLILCKIIFWVSLVLEFPKFLAKKTDFKPVWQPYEPPKNRKKTRSCKLHYLLIQNIFTILPTLCTYIYKTQFICIYQKNQLKACLHVPSPSNLHCVNRDGLFDRQNGFCQTVHFHWHIDKWTRRRYV